MPNLTNLLSKIESSRQESIRLEPHDLRAAISILEPVVEECRPERLHELIDREYAGQASWRTVVSQVDTLRNVYPELLYQLGRLHYDLSDETLSVGEREKARNLLEQLLNFQVRPESEKEVLNLLVAIYAPFGLKENPIHPFNELRDIESAMRLVRRSKLIGADLITQLRNSRNPQEINQIFRDYAFQCYMRNDLTEFLRNFAAGVEAARSLGHALVWDRQDVTSLCRYGELYAQLVAVRHFFGRIADDKTKKQLDRAIAYFNGMQRYATISDNRVELNIDNERRVNLIRSPFSETSNDVSELIVSYSEAFRRSLWDYCFIDKRAREVIKIYSKKADKLEDIGTSVKLDIVAASVFRDGIIKVPRALDGLNDKREFGNFLFARHEDIVGLSLFDFVLILNGMDTHYEKAANIRDALFKYDLGNVVAMQKVGLPLHGIPSQKQTFSKKLADGFRRVENVCGLAVSWYDKDSLQYGIGIFDELMVPVSTQYFDRSPRNTQVGVLRALQHMKRQGHDMFDDDIGYLQSESISLPDMKTRVASLLQRAFTAKINLDELATAFASQFYQLDFEKCIFLTTRDDDHSELIESPIFQLNKERKLQSYSSYGLCQNGDVIMPVYKNARWLYHMTRWLEDPKRDKNEKQVLRDHFFVHLNSAIEWVDHYLASRKDDLSSITLQSKKEELEQHGVAGRMYYFGLYLRELRERVNVTTLQNIK